MIRSFPFHKDHRVSEGQHPPREGATWCAICGKWTWREDLVAHHRAHYPNGTNHEPLILE